MSRDDSNLYTGITSTSFRNQVEARADKKKERESFRANLTPAGDRLLALCDQELASIYDMRQIFTDVKSTEAEIKAERIGRALAEKFVVGFRNQVTTLLREPRTKGVKDE